MKRVIRTAARQDILRQYEYYIAHDAPKAVDRFLAAVERAIRKLTVAPGAGTRKIVENPLLAGLRSWRVEGFKDIRIYYLTSKGAVSILRVLHGRRDVHAILGEEGR